MGRGAGGDPGTTEPWVQFHLQLSKVMWMETGLSSSIKSLLLEEVWLFLLRPFGNSAASGLARGDVSQTPHMHLCS